MRDIEEANCCPTIRPNIVVNCPFLITVVFRLFVVWLVRAILGERVVNAFVEEFRSVVRSVGPLSTWNRVRPKSSSNRGR